MARLEIEELHSDFGVRVTGVQLDAPLAAETLEEIHRAIDSYSFLCFPGQQLDDAGQLTFTQALGAPEEEHVTWGRERRIEYFGTVGNIDVQGRQQGSDHASTRYAKGNFLWHSDSSFRKVPSFVSINYAYEVPGEGGETEFVSTRAAYGRLPENLRATIEPLTVIHDYVYSRSPVAPVHPAHAESLPPVPQRLVRRNPRHGAKNYYVGSHAKIVDGWSEEESRALLDDLLARATEAPHIYAHRWSPGDLVIWDNRCLLHRGRAYDADRYRRRMRQTRVRGLGSTLDE